MKSPTKEELLLSADSKVIINIIANHLPKLDDEEQQELCLEEIYAHIETTAPYPPEFTMHSQDKRAQYEIDIDMTLITITLQDVGKLIFDAGENERYFYSVVGSESDKKCEKVFRTLS